MKIRINRYLAQAGICSRRKAEILIKKGDIKINDKTIYELSTIVDTENDEVLYSNKKIVLPQNFIYYALHKPVGYTSTSEDSHAFKKVIDLVPHNPRVYPVGRLDKNSRGLIILTNDGELANKLTHPSFNHTKKYEIEILAPTNRLNRCIKKLSGGIRLDEGVARFDSFEILKIDKDRNIARLLVALHQGWKRQIRRMCSLIGCEVIDLYRVQIGKLKIGTISKGKYEIVDAIDII